MGVLGVAPLVLALRIGDAKSCEDWSISKTCARLRGGAIGVVSPGLARMILPLAESRLASRAASKLARAAALMLLPLSDGARALPFGV